MTMRLEKLEGVRGHFSRDPACTHRTIEAAVGLAGCPRFHSLQRHRLSGIAFSFIVSVTGWLAEGQGNPPFKKEGRVSVDYEKRGRGPLDDWWALPWAPGEPGRTGDLFIRKK